MIDVQQCCEPATFDFGLPPDFMVEDDALELAALSEQLFMDAPLWLPVDEPSVQPLRSTACSLTGSDSVDVVCAAQQESPSPMVPLETLHTLEQSVDDKHLQRAASGGSASPASSGEADSYKPQGSDGGSSGGSDYTETRQPITPRGKTSATSAAVGAKKVLIAPAPVARLMFLL